MSIRQVGAATGVLFAAGLLGALYGAVTGFVGANLLVPILGAPYGLLVGAAGGFVAGTVGAALGGRWGYALGGLLGGALCSAWWVWFLSGWFILVVGALGGGIGLKVGAEADRAHSRLFLIEWLRDEIARTELQGWPWWTRLGLGMAVLAVPGAVLWHFLGRRLT